MVGTLTLAHTREELADALSTAGTKTRSTPAAAHTSRSCSRVRG